MKIIPLTQGKNALVDDEDYKYLMQWKWCAHYQPKRASGRYNVVRTDNMTGKTILMHRLVMNAPDNIMVDHKDRNPLNNQKSNLRFANHSTNGINRGKTVGYTSHFKGVSYVKSRKKWLAQICANNKIKNLGRYETELEAAIAYNKAATEKFGEFANLNQI